MDKSLRAALEASAEGRAYIVKQKSEKRAKAARARARPVKAPGLTQAKRAALAVAETARIRAVVERRAGGVGELCGKPLGEEWHLCHLDGGSGKRRQSQTTRNCVAEHPECHQGKDGIDKAPTKWIEAVKNWANAYCYPVPERFRKLEILRQSPSIPVRLVTR